MFLSAVVPLHRHVSFLLPVQLWGGWLRAWNAFAQPAFKDDLLARVEQDVVISHYNLKTSIVDFGEHRAAGWIERALARPQPPHRFCVFFAEQGTR